MLPTPPLVDGIRPGPLIGPGRCGELVLNVFARFGGVLARSLIRGAGSGMRGLDGLAGDRPLAASVSSNVSWLSYFSLSLFCTTFLDAVICGIQAQAKRAVKVAVTAQRSFFRRTSTGE